MLFPRYRFMGSSVAVSISGYGAQGITVFLLSEIGHGMEACMEACLREANTLRWGRL